jgi:DNA (cytosine-5)-methyltransferase 3A
MNVLSLFDGLSGGQIALDRLGIKVDNYYASEIDEYAISVAKFNYPNTVHLGDVQFVTKETFGNNKIDLLIGGSPCQGFSFAGKQLNFDDERSKLFFEYVRLLRDLKPKYFFLENVVMKKESQDVISQMLGVEPIKICSSKLSAQKRGRLYWTNIPNVTQPKDKGLLIKDILQEDVEDKYILSDKIQDRLQITREDKVENPIIGTTAPSFRTIGQRDVVYGHNQKMGCLVATDYKQPKQIITKPIRLGHFNNGGQGDRVYSTDGKSVCLGANGGGRGAKTGLYMDDLKVRKLTPIECERLQTIPDDYTHTGIDKNGKLNKISDTQRYKMIGNGWTIAVIEHIFKNIEL